MSRVVRRLEEPGFLIRLDVDGDDGFSWHDSLLEIDFVFDHWVDSDALNWDRLYSNLWSGLILKGHLDPLGDLEVSLRSLSTFSFLVSIETEVS